MNRDDGQRTVTARFITGDVLGQVTSG